MNLTYERYGLEVPLVESEQEVSSSSGEEVEEELIKEERPGSQVAGLGSNDLSGSLYDSKRLMEQIDENRGIQSSEFARVTKSSEEETCSEKDIAIIGFWK